MTIGPATPDTGVLSTPSGGGNLFLTVGSAAAGAGLTINDVIADNGGPVTLVISGNTTFPFSASVAVTGGYGAVTLAGTNTFSGGIVVNNGGGLVIQTDAQLGASTNGITFNGSGTLGIGSITQTSGTFTNRNITINNGGLATFNTNLAGTYVSTTWTGKITGSGGIAFSSTTSDNIAFNSTTHDFLGPVVVNGYSNASLVTMLVGGLTDSQAANGAIILNPNSGGGSTVFGLSSTATQALVLNYRQVQLAGAGTFGGLSNVNSTANVTLTVNTDLVNLSNVAKTLMLLGTNAGNNAFTGRINDGAGSATVAVAKSGTGTWIVGSTDGTLVNTYSGGTSLTAGTLVARGGGSLGTGPISIAGATLALRSDVGNDTFGSNTVTMSGNAGINVDQVATGSNLTLGVGTLRVTASTTATLTTAANSNGYSLSIGAISQTPATATTLTITNAAPLIIGSFTTASIAVPKLSFTGTANAVITGNLTQSTGPLALDRSTGNGTLILQGTSNMTGAVTITAGTIQITAATAFGNTSGISIGAAGTLAIRADASTTFGNGTTAYPLTLTGSGATINLDRLTATSASRTFTLGTLTSEGAYQLNVVGSNNSSLNLGTLSTALTSAPNRTFNNMLTGNGVLTIDRVVYTANTNNPQLTVTGIGATTITNGITQTAGTGSLVKSGTGSLTIGGTTNILGIVSVTGGSLTFNGPLQSTTTAGTSLNYGSTTAGTTTILNVNANITATGMLGSTTANTIAIYNQTSGNVTIGTIANALNGTVAGGNGFANFNLSGGTYTHGGRFTTTAGNSTGVVNVSGGTLNANGELFMVAYNANVVGTVAHGELNITGGSVNHINSGYGFHITYDSGVNTTGSLYGVVNVAGGDLNIGGTTAGRFTFGISSTTNATAIVNVAAGTLNTNGFVNGVSTGTNDNSYVNLSGGKIKAYADNTLVPADTAGHKFTTTVFGPVVNNAAQATATTNFAGGVTIDSNGFTQTINTVLRGASGYGITQADIGDLSLLLGNSGYVGTPAVTFSSVGVVAGGTPASGYSVIDATTGKLTAIVITSPGTYAADTTPTITLSGGGGSITTINLSALNTPNANTGGLNKTGTGSLVLSAAATYGGPTTVAAGTLKLTGAGTINLSPLLSIAGGATFDTTAIAGYAIPAGQTLAAYSSGIATFAGAAASKVDASLRTLDLADGTNLGTLSFSGGGLTLSSSTLKFDIGASAGDKLTISGSATVSGSNVINLSALAGITTLAVGARAYTLVTVVGGGWNSSNFSLASPTLAVNGVVYNVQLSGDANNQWLDVYAPAASAVAYWKGSIVGVNAIARRSWATYDPETFVNNFTLADGTTALSQLPGDATNVFFAASGTLAADLATTLDRSFTINSLNFTGTTGTSPITIAPGIGTDIVLTLQGANVNGNTDGRGINIASGTTSPITLSTDITLGGDQTWRNDGTAGLNISGSKITGVNQQLTIDGSGDTTIGAVLQLSRSGAATDQFIKAGSGKLILTADNSYSLPTLINGGTLEITGDGTLGDGNGSVTLSAGTTLQFNQSTTLIVYNLITSDSGNHGELKQIGAGTTVLMNDNRQFGGSVVVSNGALVSVANGAEPLVSASSITVGGSAGNTAHFIASGTLGPVAINDRGVFSPGASFADDHEVIGSVETDTLSLAAGSTFTFQFLGGLNSVDPSGIVTSADREGQLDAAYSGAWDLVTAVAIDLSGVDAAHRIKLEVVTMSDAMTVGSNPGSPGDPTGYGASLAFDPTSTSTFHWLFATTGGVTMNNAPISGDINDYFTIDTTHISATPLTGSFYISSVGNDLYLNYSTNYSAVPEPSSLVLVGLAALGGWHGERRRRYKQSLA